MRKEGKGKVTNEGRKEIRRKQRINKGREEERTKETEKEERGTK